MPSESHCPRCGAGYEQGYCPTQDCDRQEAEEDGVITSKSTVFVLDGSNNDEAVRHTRDTAEPFYVNGIRYEPGDEWPPSVGDRVAVVIANVVDEIGRLDEATAPAAAHDPYVVVPCVSPSHRRINDILIVDPYCKTCLGLGIVRVMREHVPVVHRKGSDWVRGDDIVSRLADLGGPPKA